MKLQTCLQNEQTSSQFVANVCAETSIAEHLGTMI